MDASLRNELLKVENVIGTGVSEDDGQIITIVMLSKDDNKARAAVAKLLRGIQYKIVVTDRFYAREGSRS